ncbi:MAG: hypothetical protein KKG47_09370 [Proteobacteria bacterium]|nr:hypothetical protein [Pseudomonadota bacterium]MBU1736826.1 hypothetical protein [Pseudomonadota bacterium]
MKSVCVSCNNDFVIDGKEEQISMATHGICRWCAEQRWRQLYQFKVYEFKPVTVQATFSCG